MRLSVAALLSTVALSTTLTGCVLHVKPMKRPVAEPPPPAAPAKPRRFAIKLPEVKDNKVQLPGPILFETNLAKIKPESEAVLELVYEYLNATPKVTKHRIEGHTDTQGDDAKNLELSKLRAFAVAEWLVFKGIDCKRLVPVGFGETRLQVKPEKTEDDRATNRRVDFVNAEVDGKAIAGLPVDGGGTIAGDACLLKK